MFTHPDLGDEGHGEADHRCSEEGDVQGDLLGRPGLPRPKRRHREEPHKPEAQHLDRQVHVREERHLVVRLFVCREKHKKNALAKGRRDDGITDSDVFCADGLSSAHQNKCVWVCHLRRAAD